MFIKLVSIGHGTILGTFSKALHYVMSPTALVKYLYEVKQHQRQHIINSSHVLGEPVHDPTW